MTLFDVLLEGFLCFELFPTIRTQQCLDILNNVLITLIKLIINSLRDLHRLVNFCVRVRTHIIIPIYGLILLAVHCRPYNCLSLRTSLRSDTKMTQTTVPTR